MGAYLGGGRSYGVTGLALKGGRAPVPKGKPGYLLRPGEDALPLRGILWISASIFQDPRIWDPEKTQQKRWLFCGVYCHKKHFFFLQVYTTGEFIVKKIRSTEIRCRA